MIQLVVGWVKNLFQPSKVIEFQPVSTITPALQGYYFEHEELKRLMRRLKGFETVSFTDAYGSTLTPEIIEQRFGRDGGIDCVIHIVTETERGASNVATRIRNILINQDY